MLFLDHHCCLVVGKHVAAVVLGVCHDEVVANFHCFVDFFGSGVVAIPGHSAVLNSVLKVDVLRFDDFARCRHFLLLVALLVVVLQLGDIACVLIDLTCAELGSNDLQSDVLDSELLQLPDSGILGSESADGFEALRCGVRDSVVFDSNVLDPDALEFGALGSDAEHSGARGSHVLVPDALCYAA